PGAAEPRVLPDITAPARGPPEPAEAQRERCQEHGAHERLDELAAARGELEMLVAEIALRHEELLSAHEEVGVVDAERHDGQHGAVEEDLHEWPRTAAEREPDAAPGRPAEPIPSSADDRDGHERECDRGRQRA